MRGGPPSPVLSPASAWRRRSLPRAARASDGGFTLLELVVAMLIFSIVMAASYALFDAGRGVSARAEFRAELFQTARAALQALEDDLRGAVMTGSAFDTGLIGTSRGDAKSPMDEIELVSVNVHTAGQPFDPVQKKHVETRNAQEEREKRIDVSKVTYWIETNAKKPAHGLVRERPKVLTPTSVYVRREEDIEEVARDVVFLDLRYWDQEWKDSWDSTTQNKLPKAIEATVHVRGMWRDEEILESFTTRFYLPVGAETPEKQP